MGYCTIQLGELTYLPLWGKCNQLSTRNKNKKQLGMLIISFNPSLENI